MNPIALPHIDYSVILPQIILSITAIFVMLLGLIIPRKQQCYLGIMGLGGLLIAMFFSLAHPMAPMFTLKNMAIMDGMSVGFNILFFLATAFVIVLSVPFLDKEKDIPAGEYYSLLLFATVGMVLMANTTDLMIIFLGLELMSISLYILASITRDNPLSNEAAMKYLLLGAFATGFLLYGITFIYGATGSTNLLEISKIMGDKQFSANGWMLPVGIGLILVGLGFKIGLVPFHSWIPDVYEGAPTVVTAFMSIGPKAAGFAGLIRILLSGAFLPIPIGSHHFEMWVNWPTLLAVFAGITMTVGNIIATAQGNIKRMLAYSSIAHAGYVSVALVTAHYSATSSILFYFFSYLFMNLGAFAVVYAVQKNEGERNTLKSYSGMGTKRPVLALAMTVFMLSLAGFPPSAGFMGKFYIFKNAIDAGYIGLVIVAVLNSVVSAYYYLRVIVFMYMQEPNNEETIPTIPLLVSVIILFCIMGVFFLGIFPTRILELTQLSLYF